jgi:small conductance mechanosensitive channel
MGCAWVRVDDFGGEAAKTVNPLYGKRKAVRVMIDTNQLYANLLVIGLGLLVLVIVFGVLIALLSITLRALRRVPGIGQGDILTTLGRSVRGWLLIFFLATGITFVAYGAWLTIQGQSITAVGQELLQSAVPPEFWRELGIGVAGTFGALAAARILSTLINRLMPALRDGTRRMEQVRANEASVARFYEQLGRILIRAVWIGAAGVAAILLPLPAMISTVAFTVLKIYLIITTGQLFVSIVTPLIDTLDHLSEQYVRSASLDVFYDQLRGLVPLLSRTLEYIIYVTAATLAVQQIEALAGFARYGAALVQIIAIVFLSRVVIEVVNLIIDRSVLVRGELSESEWQQRRTFGPLIKDALRYATYFGALLFALGALGIDIGPILVAIGGLGLVVGLAAQPVLTDVISGVFILFENLYLVGDYIETNEARGVVESIDVRTTRIRDPDGQVHILRNGQIGDIVNYSKGYAFAAVLVSIAYEHDLERVYRVIRETGAELDSASADVLEPTEVQGIEEFEENAVRVRTITRVRPGTHLQVARELRTRLHAAFRRERIEFWSLEDQVIYHNLNPVAELDGGDFLALAENGRMRNAPRP